MNPLDVAKQEYSNKNSSAKVNSTDTLAVG